MPPNSRSMARSIATASPRRWRELAPRRSASPPGSSGRKADLMAGAVQDRLAQPGIIFLAERRQDHRFRRLRMDQALAGQCGPDRWIAQPGRVARRDHRLAEMEMIAMRIRQFGDRDPARLVIGSALWRRLAGESRQLLQQGQRL